ncbi:MAG: phage regulatory protein [Fusobacterium necrophorum]|nr:phage regulatory protein [Fusobacterium necrophorum]
MNLKVKNEMTSLELVEQINFFREKEGSKNKLLHKNLMAVIRDEFQEEINELKIQPVEYRDKKGEKRPMFILTLSQAKQVLVRESKYVRRAIIQYIEKLEQALKKPKQTKLDFQEKDVIRTTWKGEPVIELVQLARYIHMTSDNLHFLTKRDKVTLRYEKLMEFRKENPRRYNQSVNAISILFKETVIAICKKYGIYEKYKDFINNYFRVDNRLEDKTPKVPVIRANFDKVDSKEEFLEDEYYRIMYENIKEAYEIENKIERIYIEELIPIYNQIEGLCKTKREQFLSPHYRMKYGRERSGKVK